MKIMIKSVQNCWNWTLRIILSHKSLILHIKIIKRGLYTTTIFRDLVSKNSKKYEFVHLEFLQKYTRTVKNLTHFSNYVDFQSSHSHIRAIWATMQQYNLGPGIATPMGPNSQRRLEFITLRCLQDYMLVTHLAIPLKEALWTQQNDLGQCRLWT